MPLYKNEPVIIVSYNDDWPYVFNSLKKVLQNHLQDKIIDIIHIGSTAVNGLVAKPIIDLNIIIENYHILAGITAKLSELGYRYEGEKGIIGRHAYDRVNEKVPLSYNKNWMDHHLYVCSKDNPENTRQIQFRDYLRRNPEAAAEYAALKQKLAIKYKNDRKKYTDGKHDFVEKILEKVEQNL